MYYIYSLNHPDNGVPFYIGMTQNPELRLMGHIKKQKNIGLKSLINTMLRYGREPIMEIIYHTESLDDCLVREVEFIKEYARNHVLMNIKDLYKEEDMVEFSSYESACTPYFKCNKPLECDFCANYAVATIESRINEYVRHGNKVYQYLCSDSDWAKIRKRLSRGGGSYVRIPTGADEFLLISSMMMAKERESNMSIKEAMRLSWMHNKQIGKPKRRATTGAFAG